MNFRTKIVPKFSEKKHIDAIGLDRWQHAVDAAMYRLKTQDTKLIAAPKLRRRTAEVMAIVATGGPRLPLSVMAFSGVEQHDATPELQTLVDHFIDTTEPG